MEMYLRHLDLSTLNNLTEDILPNVNWNDIFVATYETLYMTLVTTVFVFFLGILLGLLLFITRDSKLTINHYIYKVLSLLVNVFRSIPFIILIVLLIPFTRLIVGTMLGKEAALPALIIGAAPFYARIVEMSLREVNKGVLEASKAMGATSYQIITKVLIPEALPSLISGITVTAVALIGYTAMAAVIGAGGLGYLAIYDGFAYSNNDLTLVCTIISIMIVFTIQFTGDVITKRIDKR